MESIGRYRLDSELGRGAMGVVYRGFDPRMSRHVAIKVIRLDQSASVDERADRNLRFAREAAAAGNLSHANIVAVYDSGEQGELQYLVLELVDGCSLEKTLSNGTPQDRRMAVAVLSQVAGALDYAHGKGIVHRDVKPANILVRPDGAVKITDFGIARIADHTVTKTGFTMGTPAYMAPEQIMSGRVDGKADQFSLAVMAYQMLSGRMPFVADGMLALMHKIASQDPPLLRDLTNFYPPRTSDVLMKAMAKDPDGRYRTCAEFVGDLSASLEEVRPAAPVPELAARNARAWLPWAVALGAAALVSVILLAAFGFFNRPVQFASVAGPLAGTPAPRPPEVTPPTLAKPAPVVSQFTAEPASIQRGQASTLHWQVSGNAASVSIDQGIGAVQSAGSRRVVPDESTTYTLTAVGPGGTTTASLALGVAAPAPAAPVVAQFTAEPASIQRGQPSTLHWQVSGNATSVSIDRGIGAVQSTGSRRVGPSESTTYTLTATGPGGTTSASLALGVAAPAPAAPVVAQFTAEPASIQRGQASTLHWQVSGNAASVSIDQGIGAVQSAGSRRVVPGESTTYTLAAAGPGGSAAASVTLSVAAPPPPVVRSGPHVGDSKTERDGLKYMWIPPGTFTMGCSPGDSECFAEEKPAHEVTITRGFWLGQTDVTVAAYKRYAQAVGKPMPPEKDSLGRSLNAAAGNDSLPVVAVTWYEASGYCGWAGSRLPTEAEWELAARAGTTGARYDKLDDIAWYGDNAGRQRIDSAAIRNADQRNYAQKLYDNGNGPKPAGQKRPNPFGLYDMLGNVWQWTADWYGNYQAGAAQDPAGPPSGTLRTLRGGSWLNIPTFVRASSRSRLVPGYRDYSLFGLRCVGE